MDADSTSTGNSHGPAADTLSVTMLTGAASAAFVTTLSNYATAEGSQPANPDTVSSLPTEYSSRSPGLNDTVTSNPTLRAAASETSLSVDLLPAAVPPLNSPLGLLFPSRVAEPAPPSPAATPCLGPSPTAPPSRE